jgi:hypothetical protein
MANTPEKDWFDYPRAAKYLHDRVPGGFTVRSLEHAKRTNKIPGARIRGRIWFKKADLDNYVKEITTV